MAGNGEKPVSLTSRNNSVQQHQVCILGSTGSIGESTLDIIQRHPERFTVISLSAHSRVDKMLVQCLAFKPQHVVMGSEQAAASLKEKLTAHGVTNINVEFGNQALCDIAKDDNVDTVMAAIVGSSGLLPTLAAVKAGKRVLLANKESLVTSGQIFIDAVKTSGAKLLPIDSEHNAIFQCLPEFEQHRPGECELADNGISKILLTGSGGPFRTRAVETLSAVTPDEACAHPNWDMGRKISVDSATMMNKGLEFIEAKWLFNVQPEQIQVVLHPQSTIHSMVQYKDGSVLAQMGNPDMRTPIAHALAYPERIDAGVEPLDFFNTKAFEFEQVDYARYPNLKLAIEACSKGQAACTALNAGNEIAVAAFLAGDIKFTDIYKVNESSVDKFVSERVDCIDDVMTLDGKAREFASAIVAELKEQN